MPSHKNSLDPEEIRTALRASRVVPLDVPNPHGPFGLEQLAAAVEIVRRGNEDMLAIKVRHETRRKLEQLARDEGRVASQPVTAAEIAAAIVAQYVSAAPLP